MVKVGNGAMLMIQVQVAIHLLEVRVVLVIWRRVPNLYLAIFLEVEDPRVLRPLTQKVMVLMDM
jgi:hypothetical protein